MKLLVVKNEMVAKEVSPIMGEDWRVAGLGSALMGSIFDSILVVAPLEYEHEIVGQEDPMPFEKQGWENH